MKTHLVFALMTISLLALVISQDRRKTVTFDTIVGVAARLSREPYSPPRPAPTALRALSYDQVRDIRFREEDTLWRHEGLPFQARFFFGAGEHNSTPVTIFQVNRDGAGQLRFDPRQFDFGPLVKLPPADQAIGAYSGFRLYYPLKKPDQLDEVLVFQGASYFRPLAKSVEWGLSARGIAVDPLGKEDFPAFTTFWLVQPSPNAAEMIVYALLEGRDLTGAYEFRIQPGESTRIHVRAALFARDLRRPGRAPPPRAPSRSFGVAPLTTMFWYGENTSNTFGDWRPEVHDSDGLQIHRADGEWIWHPLSWAKQRQVNVFADAGTRGFGLFQRDRDFTHYQDLEAKYHLRPSAWVEPDGDWGKGSVVLMQNATGDEFADNVVAYWAPDRALAAGERRDFAYALVVFSKNAALPPVATCVSTRIDYQDKPNFRQIVLTFSGGSLDGLPADARPQIDVWVDRAGILSDVQCQKIPGTGSWQASFGVTASDVGNPVEMRCSLSQNGRPVTETWTYTWVK